MMGLTGASHVELFSENVKLGPEHRLGPKGRDSRSRTRRSVSRVRLAQVGARAIGKASRLCTMMTGYANERRQFGKAIGEFQMIQQMIADSVIDINGARSCSCRAAGRSMRVATLATGFRW